MHQRYIKDYSNASFTCSSYIFCLSQIRESVLGPNNWWEHECWHTAKWLQKGFSTSCLLPHFLNLKVVCELADFKFDAVLVGLLDLPFYWLGQTFKRLQNKLTELWESSEKLFHMSNISSCNSKFIIWNKIMSQTIYINYVRALTAMHISQYNVELEVGLRTRQMLLNSFLLAMIDYPNSSSRICFMNFM